ncbi:MAG: PAS domain S-box protein, partial [Holophaga sp.]|nr:PAS domain S-box protein [Holophaga sp.]
MVQFNTRANEILLKLVYYGPGLSGKTTNLQSLHAMCQEVQRGELFSVNTQEDRTLFFDLLPINLGYIYGNAIHLQIYTVPGQVQYDASRRVVLGGADGVVFVADSSEAKMQENVDSLSNLYHNLNANRLNIKQIPFVLQYNKRDLPDAMPVGVMNRRLNFRSAPFFESVANRGTGVLDTFLAITKETVGTTFQKYHLDKKIKDFDEMLNLIETNIRSSMRDLPPSEEPAAPPSGTVLRHSQVTVGDLVPGTVVDPQDLLEDALKSNMETARLYTELKQTKDVLEQKNQELAVLAAQNERSNQENLKTRRYLEGLIQSVAEAIISFSHDGRILTWNTAAEQIFGYPRSEIVGHAFQKLIPGNRVGELEQAIAQVSKGQIIRDVLTVRVRKNGEEFPASITYAPIRGSDDRVLAFSALVRDMGEQRSLERRLEHAETSSSLARIMPPLFNELANRLGPVLLQKGLLLETTTDPEQQVRMSRLLQAVDATQNLLRPLMMVLSPSSPRLEPCNVNTLVQEAAKRIEGEAAAAGVAMDFTLASDLPECGLDSDQVREALVNLFRSAVFASVKSPVKRVRVGTRLAENAIQIVSQDTGPAIPEPENGRVFELAAAIDVESLGLCMAATVVQAHGGRISVRSQEGVGNAFLLELPMTESNEKMSIPASLDGKKVLVVDDEAFLLE